MAGIVTDNLNEQMIGVSILEKGTTNACITNIDGDYFLTVNKEIVIRVMLSAQERYGCNVYQCLQ